MSLLFMAPGGMIASLMMWHSRRVGRAVASVGILASGLDLATV